MMPEAASNPKNASNGDLRDFLSQTAPGHNPDRHPDLNRDRNQDGHQHGHQDGHGENGQDVLRGPAFHHSISLHLRGSLDEVALIYALELLVSQQAALRLIFKAADGDAALRNGYRRGCEQLAPAAAQKSAELCAQASMPLPLECRDLSWLNAGDAAEEWRSILRHEASAPFDLYCGPLFRTLLVRMSSLHHVLVFTAHPSIANASAIRAMMTELPRLYGSVTAGAVEAGAGEAGAGEVGGLDHPIAKLQAVQPGNAGPENAGPENANPENAGPGNDVPAVTAALHKSLRMQADAELPASLLPADFLRYPNQINIPSTYSHSLDTELADMCCRAWSQEGEKCGAIAAFAAYVLWLHRTTGQNELICAVDMSCVPAEGQGSTEFAPDFFALDSKDGLLPVRSILLPEDDAVTFTARLQANLKEGCRGGRREGAGCLNWGHNQFHFEREEKPLRFADLAVELVWNARNSLSAELAFYFRICHGKLWLNCSYNAALFRSETILRWSAEMERLLHAMLERPQQALSQTAWLSSDERHRLVFDLNQTARTYPRDYSIQELFERQVLRTPDAIALVNEEGSLTYSELNEKANQLARFISRYGVRRGDRIALVVERSLASVVGALAALKIGCAYVPIDALEPGHAVQDVVEHSKPAAILTQAQFAPIFRSHVRSHATPMVLLDEDWAAVATEAVESLAFPIAAEAPACVLYRRDAASHLRGVVLPQRSLVRQAHGCGDLNFGAGEVFLQLARPTEDAWALEVWGPLLNGGKVAMLPPGWQAPIQIGSAIEHYGATTVWLSPAQLERIAAGHIDALAPLRQIVLGASAWGTSSCSTDMRAMGTSSPSLHRRLLARYPGLKVVCGFGPAENGSFTCMHAVSAASSGDAHADVQMNVHASLSLDSPMANTRVYILDQDREVVRLGVAGELHVAGDGLATGYLHAPELTEQKFFMHTFSPRLRERLFRTGMLARYRDNGRIEVLGPIEKTDNIEPQIKAASTAEQVSAAEDGTPEAVRSELKGWEALEFFLAD